MVLKGLIYLIKGYGRYVSPQIPQRCRFLPTCSEYAIIAIEKRGYHGLWLAIRRMLKCHPWGQKGFDPVPTTKEID